MQLRSILSARVLVLALTAGTVLAPSVTAAPARIVPTPDPLPAVASEQADRLGVVHAPAPHVERPQDVEGIIRQIWPDDLEDQAIRVAWRESTHQPDVRNYCCYGLFQIYWSVHRDWLADLGIDEAEDLYDPWLNTIAAWTLYQDAGGWGPWGL